jgi:hypothetical protein
MPYICPATGEMAKCFECGADVTCECAAGSLATVVVVTSHSAVSDHDERWVWKDDAQLDASEHLQLHKIEAAGVLMVPKQKY